MLFNQALTVLIASCIELYTFSIHFQTQRYAGALTFRPTHAVSPVLSPVGHLGDHLLNNSRIAANTSHRQGLLH